MYKIPPKKIPSHWPILIVLLDWIGLNESPITKTQNPKAWQQYYCSVVYQFPSFPPASVEMVILKVLLLKTKSKSIKSFPLPLSLLKAYLDLCTAYSVLQQQYLKMDRKAREGKGDLWSEIFGESESEQQQSTNSRAQLIYQRRRRPPPQPPSHSQELQPSNHNRHSLAAANKRVSWNRSLSTRFLFLLIIFHCPHLLYYSK